MKRFLDFLTNSPAAVTFAVLAVAGVIFFAIPATHAYAWIGGLILCLGIAGALLMFHGEWRRSQTQIDALRRELSVERGRQDVLGLTPVDDEVAQIPDEIAADRILTLLPATEGLVQSLRQEAAFGSLAVAELEPLSTFRSEFAKASFDNPRSHTAFMNLYRAAQALSIWVKEETILSPSDDSRREIRPGDTREGGWREYTEAKTHGERLGDELVAARSNFNQTVLELGLVG